MDRWGATPSIVRAAALAALPLVAWWLAGPVVGASVLAGYAVAAGVVLVRHRRAAVVHPRTDYIVPLELPPAPYVVGRDDDLDRLRGLLTPGAAGPRVVGVCGPPGIGKTVLAIHVAHAMSHAYPGGQLYTRFWAQPRRPARETAEPALREFVRSLQGPWDADVDDVDVDGLRRRYVELTRSAQVLVVLDDVAPEVAELLRPAGRGCALLLTSREPFPLPGGEWHELGPLPEAASFDLFTSMVGPEAVDTAAGRRVAARLVQASLRVPLALRLVATLVMPWPWWNATSVVRLLGDRPDAATDPEPLDIGYTLLTADERLAVRMLGLLPAGEPLAPWMLAALLDVEVPTARVVIERLVHAGMVERVDSDVPGGSEFRVLDRVHDYALRRLREATTDRELAALRHTLEEARRDQARSREIHAVQRRVLTLQDAGKPGEALVYAGEAVAWALQQGRPRLLAVAQATLAELHIELGNLEAAEDLARAARDAAAETGDPVVRAQALRGLGRLLRRQGQPDAALGRLTEALRLLDAARQAGHDERAERVRLLRHRAAAFLDSGQPDRGLADLTAAEELNEGLPESDRAPLVAGLAWARAMIESSQRPDDAIALMHRAQTAAVRSNQALWHAWITLDLARIHAQRDDLAAALRHAQSALDGFGRMGHRYGKAKCRVLIARVRRAEAERDGRPDPAALEAAAAELQIALETFRNCGDRWVEADAARELAEIRTRQHQTRAAAALLRTSERQFTAVGDARNAERVRRTRRRGWLLRLVGWSVVARLDAALATREAAGR